jgi:predicted transcriptional regulator
MNTEKHDPYLISKIIKSYLGHNRLAASELSDLITTLHRAIGQLGQPPEPKEVRAPAVSVRRSVHRDYVICLDCGFRGKALRRHLTLRHGLSRLEYLQRWKLPSDHPLTAPAYSQQRSALAKALGLGRKQGVPVTATPIIGALPGDTDRESQAAPTRKRRSRSRSKPANVVNEAAVAPPPSRRGRPRSRVASPPSMPTSSPTAET